MVLESSLSAEAADAKPAPRRVRVMFRSAGWGLGGPVQIEGARRGWGRERDCREILVVGGGIFYFLFYCEDEVILVSFFLSSCRDRF